MGDLPEHVIMDLRPEGIENILNQIQNYSQDKLVYIDNSIFCWMVDYIGKTDVKNLKTELMEKATMQYEGLAKQLGTGNIYMPKEIASELKKSAELTIDELDICITQYQKLSNAAQKTHAPIKKAIDNMKKSAQTLKHHAIKLETQTENQVVTELAIFLERIKKYCKWGEKTRFGDIYLVANAFAQALTTQKEVYILSEDRDIEQTTECLYHLLTCNNLGVPPLLKDHPARVSVLRAKGYDEYTIKFTYNEKLIGNSFAIKGYLRDYYKNGSQLNKDRTKDNREDSFETAKRTTILLKTMLNRIKAAEPKKTPEPKKIVTQLEALHSEVEHLATLTGKALAAEKSEAEPASPEINAIAAKALKEGAIKDPAKTLETLRAIAEQKGKEETAAALTEIVEKEDKFSSSSEIIRDYVRKAYETPGETPEKKTAKSALEELANAGVDVKEDLKNIRKIEIKHEINTLATEIPQLRIKIKQMVNSEKYDDNELDKINKKIIEKNARKTELQSKIYKEPEA